MDRYGEDYNLINLPAWVREAQDEAEEEKTLMTGQVICFDHVLFAGDRFLSTCGFVESGWLQRGGKGEREGEGDMIASVPLDTSLSEKLIRKDNETRRRVEEGREWTGITPWPQKSGGLKKEDTEDIFIIILVNHYQREKYRSSKIK